jgi:hypothetical protein
MSKKTYTAEEKTAFAQRDKELAEAADAALAQPGAGTRLIAIALRSPKLASYSLRNQMMLALQAERAGIVLHDVDTGRGWKARGRFPRKGTRAVLRIVYPITRRSGRDTESGDADPEGRPGPTLFRTKAVFEISQTEPQPDCTPASQPEADPARIWHDRLTREADTLGYAVTYARPDQASAPAVVSGATKTITVAAGDPLAPAALGALADRLAEVMTAARTDLPAASRTTHRGGPPEPPST